MARYRKIDVRTWTDEKFAKLSDAAKLVFLHLLTGHHTTNLPAAFLATEESLQSFSGMGFETHSKGLQEVFRNGLATADFEHKLVFLPNGFRHNPPENPNVAKGWIGRIEELPDCPLKADVIRAAIQAVTDAMESAKPKARKDFETVSKRLAKGLETISKPRAVAVAVARTEAGAESGADAPDTAAGPSVPTPPAPPAALTDPASPVNQPLLTPVPPVEPPKPKRERRPPALSRQQSLAEQLRARRRELMPTAVDDTGEIPVAVLNERIGTILEKHGEEGLRRGWENWLRDSWALSLDPPCPLKAFIAPTVWPQRVAAALAPKARDLSKGRVDAADVDPSKHGTEVVTNAF